MRIASIGPEFSESYENFLRTHAETTLYQSWSYQRLLVELLGCHQEGILAIDEDENILAALPLMSMNGPLGVVYNSLPFYGSNGGLIGEDEIARSMLIATYNKMVVRAGVASSTIIENPLLLGGAQGGLYDYVDERVGQLTPLPATNNSKLALMDSFHYKTRNMIRKAEKLGVDVIIDNDAIPFLIHTHEENMREIGGLAKPRQFFDIFPSYFCPGKDYQIYVALIGGQPVAALLTFSYNRTVEYFTPVVRKEYRDSQALSAVIFRAMCDAADRGFAWWNWGGTWLSQDGVYRFKSRWGTEDKKYRYFTTVQNPAVLKSSHLEILRDYQSFFTVPFSALSSSRDQ